MNKVQRILLAFAAAGGSPISSREVAKRSKQGGREASIRCNALKNRGDIKIVSEKAGRAGALFRITAKGLRRAELLRLTGRTPADAQCEMSIVESALLSRHPLMLAWSTL